MGIILTSTGLPLLSATGLIARRAAAAGAGGGASPGGGGAQPSSMWGWDPSIDLGTDGDLFVDASVRTSGDGTSLAKAKKTIAEAVAASSAGDVIRVKGGIYRERVRPNNGTSVLAYGTDRPIVTGLEVLTGLVRCTGADQAIVGPNHASIYKVENFPVSKLSTNDANNADFRCLNLHEVDENGIPQMLDWAVTWAGGDIGDRWFYPSHGDWMTADSVEVVGGKIQSLTSASLFAAMSDAALLAKGVILYLVTTPNTQVTTTIASIDRANNRIVPANLNVTHESNADRDKFLLLNVAGNLHQGEWAYVDNGDGACNVYVWPRNPANVAGGIEYSARTNCMSVDWRNNITIKGFNLIGSAGGGAKWNGAVINGTNSGGQGPNIDIQHCRLAGSYGFGSATGCAVRMELCDHFTFKHNTVQDIRGYGLFIAGRTHDVRGPCDIQYNHFERLSSTPCRFSSVKDAVFAFNKTRLACWSGHANKTNAYEQCYQILWWGNVFEDCSGYLTWQEASAVHVAFNYLSATRDPTGNTRAIWDQGNGTAPPSGWATPPAGATDPGLVFNNTLIPEPWKIGSSLAKAIRVTAPNSVNHTNRFSVANNIFHGADIPHPAGIVTWTRNLDVGPGSVSYGSDVKASPGIWVDARGNNFDIATTGEGAALRTATGHDLTSWIRYLQSKFGDRIAPGDWNKDCLGNTFDPASPPLGCITGYDYSSLRNPLWGMTA